MELEGTAPGWVGILGTPSVGEESVVDDLQTLLRQRNPRWEVVRLEGENLPVRDNTAALVVLNGSPEFLAGNPAPLFLVVNEDRLEVFLDAVYQATGLLEVRSAGLDHSDKSDANRIYSDLDVAFNTWETRLQAPRFRILAEEAFRHLWDIHMRRPDGGLPDMPPLVFRRVPFSHILAVRVESADPGVAAIAANAAVETAERFSLQNKSDMSDRSAEFLKVQAERQRAVMLRAQEALRSFQLQRKPGVAAIQREADQEGFLQLNRELQDIEREQRNGDAETPDPELRRRHAAVKGLLEEVKARMELQEIQAIEINAQLRLLSREYEIQEAAYLAILNRMEEARLASDAKSSLLMVVEKARLPERRLLKQGIRGLVVRSPVEKASEGSSYIVIRAE